MIREALAAPLPTIGAPGPSFGSLSEAMGAIVGGAFQILLVVAGLYALFQIIIAGYGMIASGGDKGHLAEARGKILWSIIGLFIIAASWALILLAQQMLGTCLGLGCFGNLKP